jgi:hypothetical protein
LQPLIKVTFPEYEIYPLCYFGDLGIEQYTKADDKFWYGEIMKNFDLIQSQISKIGFTECKLLKLSDESILNESIGRAGKINLDISNHCELLNG